MEGPTNFSEWLAREAQLSQKHEEILAKREMLLAVSESLASTQRKKQKVITRDFHRAKARNDELLKDMEELHNRLQKKTNTSSNADAQLIGQQESYWKMVEEEFPRWLSRNSAANRSKR